jgi:predicted SAM-dependent methyltransferase
MVRRLVNIVYRLDRQFIAKKYLTGEGIEIGALHNPLKVPRHVKVRYVDIISPDDSRIKFNNLKTNRRVEVDIFDDGETLSKIRDGSQDFVIANHFLEHCKNPIIAIKNMLRVLKVNGILFVTIPDKRFTFDENRDVTPIEHLFSDYEKGPKFSLTGHMRDVIIKTHGVKDEYEIEKKCKEFIKSDERVHFHVWTSFGIFELFYKVKMEYNFTYEVQFFMLDIDRGDVVVILKKI